MKFFLFLLGIAFAGGSKIEHRVQYTPTMVIEAMRASNFDDVGFRQLWWKYFDSRKEMRKSHSEEWDKEVDYILQAAVREGSVASVRVILGFEYPSDPTHRNIFDPSRGLYKVVRAWDMDETKAAHTARVLIEFGAVPTMVGLTDNEEYSNLTCIEIAIRSRKPLVVQALLQDPSPLDFDVLEELGERDMATKRGIEVYRTRVIREIIAAKRSEKLNGIIYVRGPESNAHNSKEVRKIIAMFQDARVFIFAERYIQSLACWVVYLMFVFLLADFLYQLRVKRVPVNSKLMIPIPSTEKGVSFEMLVSGSACLASGIPTSNLFETLSLGLASIGAIFWCEHYCYRTDLSTTLVLTIIVQSLLTLASYYAYAPRSNPHDDALFDEEPPLYRVMFYPHGKDMSAAVLNCAMYIIACSSTFMLLFSVLNPVQAMYFCPGESISDTYGFEGSLTRIVATLWDILIFFILSLRIYRTVETVVVFDLIGHLLKPRTEYPEETK